MSFKHPGWPAFFGVLGGAAVALFLLFLLAANFPR